MRKLATIRRIDDIQPIKKADAIEVATVGGWKSVVKKGEFEVGQTIIYCEIDSFLPIREEFEFLRPSSYLKLEDGTEGFRLRTVKLRGQVSQGLIIPLNSLVKAGYEFDLVSVIPADGKEDHADDYTTYNLKVPAPDYVLPLKMGTDVTELLGITKYEKPIPKELEGRIHGYMDSRIKKTNEERIQNLTDDYEELKKYAYVESEKLDGESFTAFVLENRFGVCTRELDLIIPEEYSDDLPNHLKYSLKNNMEEKVRSLGKNVAFQGELIGPGISKNKYNLKELQFRLFNIFDIETYSYYPKHEMIEIAKDLSIRLAPIVFDKTTLPNTVDELLKTVEGKSYLNLDTEREGSVFVSTNSPERISFKVISNKYLLKGGE